MFARVSRHLSGWRLQADAGRSPQTSSSWEWPGWVCSSWSVPFRCSEEPFLHSEDMRAKQGRRVASHCDFSCTRSTVTIRTSSALAGSRDRLRTTLMPSVHAKSVESFDRGEQIPALRHHTMGRLICFQASLRTSLEVSGLV